MVAVIILFGLAILLAIICNVNITKDISQTIEIIESQKQEQIEISQEQIEISQEHNFNDFDTIITPILQSYNIQPKELKEYISFNLRVDPYYLFCKNWNKGEPLLNSDVSWIYLKNQVACKLYQDLLEKWDQYINQTIYLSSKAELCSNYSGGMNIEIDENPILCTLLPVSEFQECELKPGIYYNGYDSLVGIQQTIDYMQQQYDNLKIKWIS